MAQNTEQALNESPKSTETTWPDPDNVACRHGHSLEHHPAATGHLLPRITANRYDWRRNRGSLWPSLPPAGWDLGNPGGPRITRTPCSAQLVAIGCANVSIRIDLMLGAARRQASWRERGRLCRFPGRTGPAKAYFAAGVAAHEADDLAGAFEEWLPEAESRNDAAQRNIGLMYQIGRGVDYLTRPWPCFATSGRRQPATPGPRPTLETCTWRALACPKITPLRQIGSSWRLARAMWFRNSIWA